MIYLQQFDFKIEHRTGKKMPHVDYLSRSPVEQPMIHHPEELTEETFVGQVCVSRKIKYVIAFIYNAYGPWMSVRTDRRKEIYNLHQSLEGAVETEDSNSFEAALRKLREETGLRIHQSRSKWIGYDPKYDCDIYAIELDIGKNPRWTEQDKMGPWGIIPWDMYINMAASRLLTPTYCIHTKMFLKEAGIISSEVNVTFDDMVEEMRYDPEDASDK